jgi:predicted phosphoadenosine phosphosulfate sulfurtransferase
MPRVSLPINVLEAARQRIAWAFDTFDHIQLAFSAGKDSTVMLHLVMAEAKARNRKVSVILIDLEAQYALTIQHAQAMFDLYSDHIIPYWVCAPLRLRNAVSVYEPQWVAWEPTMEELWVRKPPARAMTIKDPLIEYVFQSTHNMEFETFIEMLEITIAQDTKTAIFVGIRTAESLNRLRTIAGHGHKYEGRNYTNHVARNLWKVYPLYDWRTSDIWIYHQQTGLPYNKLYDRMYMAGLTPHQMRICQPYGDDQRKGLWLFHIIEPQTWAKVVARVSGANQGALYANTSGNVLGNYKTTKPDHLTYKEYAYFLLASMPGPTAEHYRNKIAVFIKWYADRGYPDGIPDTSDIELERAKTAPSWRRVVHSLLRNDYWCKGLGFSNPVSISRDQYNHLMLKRRKEWNILPPLSA